MSFNGMPVLVTGGAGFIGSHLVDALVDAGCRVRVLDNFSNGTRTNLEHRASEIDLLEGDIRDFETCRAACDGVRTVFHQAALGSVPRSLEAPATSLAVNVAGTVNVFTAARDAGAHRIVYASSSSVYGDSRRSPKREGEEGRPLSPYALSKWMNEETAEVFARCYELELIGLRYFNVYGPRQSPEGPYAAVIPRFFRAAITGKPATIYGDGEQSRDFTSVADAVRANLKAAAAPASASGRAFNVAAGKSTTVLRLARSVAAAAGLELPVEHVPPRPGDVRHSLADLEHSKKILGYEPSVALNDGLCGCIDYYRELFGRSKAQAAADISA